MSLRYLLLPESLTLCQHVSEIVLNGDRFNTFNVFGVLSLRKRSTDVKNRNIVLKIKTYQRLERYMVKLIRVKGNPKITFDEVVNVLLDKVTNYSREKDDAK